MPLYLCSTTSKYRLIFYQKRRLSSIKSLSVSSLGLLHLLLPSLFLPSSFLLFLSFLNLFSPLSFFLSSPDLLSQNPSSFFPFSPFFFSSPHSNYLHRFFSPSFLFLSCFLSSPTSSSSPFLAPLSVPGSPTF